MKRGQTQTIFIWIFIAVVAGLIFIFGFKMIGNITSVGEDVKVVKFFQNFEKKVNEYYYLDDGSQGSEEFWLPGWVEYICVRGSEGFTDESMFDNKIKSLVNDDGFQDRNVFFVPIKDSGMHMKEIDKLGNSNSVCMEVYGGSVKISFKNVNGVVNVE